jgi:hypothetical protein
LCFTAILYLHYLYFYFTRILLFLILGNCFMNLIYLFYSTAYFILINTVLKEYLVFVCKYDGKYQQIFIIVFEHFLFLINCSHLIFLGKFGNFWWIKVIAKHDLSLNCFYKTINSFKNWYFIAKRMNFLNSIFLCWNCLP